MFKVIRFNSRVSSSCANKEHLPPVALLDFSPFVFQILSQMLELHTNHSEPLSNYYNEMLPPLLTPTLWELRGNVPALVRLLRAYLRAGASRIVAENRISAMLGVFQKLIGSKLNDVYGFELLEALFEHVPV
jgi:exportin-2 (importin alpha re-exporter)